MTGQAPMELIEPELPGALAYVWQWFLELSSGRGSNGFGPAALSYRDIAAWADLMRIRPTPFEVELIRAMDGLFFSECVAETPKKTG